jgi:hypothetical protein
MNDPDYPDIAPQSFLHFNQRQTTARAWENSIADTKVRIPGRLSKPALTCPFGQTDPKRDSKNQLDAQIFILNSFFTPQNSCQPHDLSTTRAFVSFTLVLQIFYIFDIPALWSNSARANERYQPSAAYYSSRHCPDMLLWLGLSAQGKDSAACFPYKDLLVHDPWGQGYPPAERQTI